MKRLCLLVLTFALLLLGGCRGGSGDIDVVRVWTNDGGGKYVWNKLVDEFNRNHSEKYKVKIEWTTLGSDYYDVIERARRKGELPDIIACGAAQSKKFIKNGDILPIDEFEGGREFLDEYNSITEDRFRIIDGKVYGVYSTSNVAGLIYNKDLFRKAGIVDSSGEPTPPKTLKEMREYARRITDKKKNIYGYSYPLNFSLGHSTTIPFSTSARIRYNDDTKTADISEYKPLFETLLGMKDDGSVFPDALTLDNDTSRLYFAEGRVGMMAGISWDVSVLTTQFVCDDDWGVAPFPTADGVAKYPAWYDISGSLIITKNAKKTDDKKIMAVYKFIHSYETRKEMYENNVRISCMTDVQENANEENMLPQFKQFAKLFDERYCINTPDIILADGFEESWKSVWQGKMTVDEMLSLWQKTEGKKMYKQKGK